MELTKEIVRARVDAAVSGDFAALRAEYQATNGSILDSDRAKELFPEFSASLQSRRNYSSVVYPAAARFIDRLFDELLAEDAFEKQQRLICFTAGGPGSGKSSVVNAALDVFSSAALVLDGTLSDIERAQRQISSSLTSGFEVQIFFVYRRLEDCLRGVWQRAMSNQNARATPFRVVIDKHNGALLTIRELRRRYRRELKSTELASIRIARPSISFWCHQFEQTGLPLRSISWNIVDEAPVYNLAKANELAHSVLHECERASPSELRSEAQSLRRILAEGLG